MGAQRPATGRVRVLGCPIDALTLEESVARVQDAVARRETCQHVAINAAKLVRFQNDQALRGAIEGCELITADGQAVVWAGRILGQPIPERVTGIDLMDALLAAAEHEGQKVFLLGARADVLARAERAISMRHPTLRVAGRQHGYFTADEEDGVVDQIAGADPDLLFVALETPAKELFLARHREQLGIPFVMGVGGAFDVLAGVRRRAPRLFRRLGLEWLYRLAQDPRRMARRYIVGNSRFIWLVLHALPRARLRG